MDQEWTAISLFAGIGGFEIALGRAGVRTVASVELDNMARGVLAHQFPDVALFDDVVKVEADDLLDCGFVPDRGILTAGFPCQDVSLAGKRAGLAGERSGLFWHIIRLATQLQPRWLLIENVPGLLTSHGGADMATVVGAMVECGYGVSWRVLDAQHFGVPQRRRRVFVAGCLGDIARAGEVLLEPESGARDSAAGGAAGKKTARTTQDGFGGSRGTTAERGLVQAITGSLATGGPDAQHACAGWLVPQKVSTLQAQGSDSRGHRIDAEGAAGGQLIPVPAVANTLTSRYGKGVNTTADDGALAVTYRKSRRAHHDEDWESWEQDEKTNTLNTFDTPTDARTTELVTFALMPNAGQGADLSARRVSSAPALTATDLAKMTDRGLRVVSVTGDVSHTLTADGFDASEDGTGRGWPTVAFALRGRQEGIRPEVHEDGQTVGTLRAADGGSSRDYLASVEWGVRRLTPLECERLQGFPDRHTAQRWDYKRSKVVDQSDSARGHQLGNAVAVPVVQWIVQRIVANEAADV